MALFQLRHGAPPEAPPHGQQSEWGMGSFSHIKKTPPIQIMSLKDINH